MNRNQQMDTGLSGSEVIMEQSKIGKYFMEINIKAINAFLMCA